MKKSYWRPVIFEGKVGSRDYLLVIADFANYELATEIEVTGKDDKYHALAAIHADMKVLSGWQNVMKSQKPRPFSSINLNEKKGMDNCNVCLENGCPHELLERAAKVGFVRNKSYFFGKEELSEPKIFTMICDRHKTKNNVLIKNMVESLTGHEASERTMYAAFIF